MFNSWEQKDPHLTECIHCFSSSLPLCSCHRAALARQEEKNRAELENLLKEKEELAGEQQAIVRENVEAQKAIESLRKQKQMWVCPFLVLRRI